jgi:hypothetical protein
MRMATTKARKIIAGLCCRLSHIIVTARGIRRNCLFVNAGVSRNRGGREIELLPSVLVHAHYLQDVRDVGFHLQQCSEHLGKKTTLDDSTAVANLAVVRIMNPKTLGKSWVDVTHENPCNINGILLQVIEGSDGIEEGGVVDLCTKPGRNTFIINITLTDMVKNQMRLHGVAWN